MTNRAITELLGPAMIDRAIASAGLDDFGDPRFLADYRNFVAAIAGEVRLSPQGEALTDEFVHRMLVNHLRIEQAFKAHPEIADEALAPPIVITGFARSGTTKLQQMISAAPGVQSLNLWKLLNPAPLPDSDGAATDPRITFALEAERGLREGFPEMWAAHPTPAMNAEEDMLINDMSYVAPSLPMRLGAADATLAFAPIDPHMYAYTRRVLQYLQWQDGTPDRATRPWVLKCPVHIGNLTTILDLYPGARIVHTHRDVETSMASTCGLTRIAWGMFVDEVDMAKNTAMNIDYWSREWERNIAQRAEIDPASYCDVRFEEVNAGAMPVIERIFAFAGIDLTEADRAAMLAWEAENTRHKHGLHRYSAEEAGITPQRVATAFAAYHDYFSGADALRIPA